MSSIIVAGGSGYIGQEVVRAALNTRDQCLRGGHRVVNIDLHPPRPLDPRLGRAGGYYDVNSDPRVKFIQADLSDPQQAARAFEEALAWADDVQAVCNQVGMVRYGWRDEQLYRPNVKAVENLARECAARGLFFQLFSGTAVHGNEARGKIKETAPVKPIEAYGRSKAQAERIVFEHVTARNLKAIIFRSTNPIGPELQLSELNKLYESVMNDPLIPAVRGSRATYVSTEDVGRAFVFAAENADTVLPKAPEKLSDIVYNLGVREASPDTQVITHLIRSIHGDSKKPVVQLDPNIIIAVSYLFTAWAWAGNAFRRRRQEPLLHYELARLFKGSHDQDQTKFLEVFEANGFKFKHATSEEVLDLGTAYKFLTDWAEKNKPERISALTQRLLDERTSASYS